MRLGYLWIILAAPAAWATPISVAGDFGALADGFDWMSEPFRLASDVTPASTFSKTVPVQPSAEDLTAWWLARAANGQPDYHSMAGYLMHNSMLHGTGTMTLAGTVAANPQGPPRLYIASVAGNFTGTFSEIPERATFSLVGIGFVLLAWKRASLGAHP